MLRPTKSKIGDWSGSCMDNGYTIMESNYVIFIFAFISNDDQLSKERICSHRSKFFPFRVDPIMRRLHQQRKRTVITQVMSPSETSHGGVRLQRILISKTNCSCSNQAGISMRDLQ